jgi:hypothetical protein
MADALLLCYEQNSAYNLVLLERITCLTQILLHNYSAAHVQEKILPYTYFMFVTIIPYRSFHLQCHRIVAPYPFATMRLVSTAHSVKLFANNYSVESASSCGCEVASDVFGAAMPPAKPWSLDRHVCVCTCKYMFIMQCTS